MAANTTQKEVPREEIRRLQAREDFVGLGSRRSVNKLYDTYVDYARANPDEAHTIPTRNREQIYQWSKEDNWETYALRRDMETQELASESLEKITAHTHKRLALLHDDVLTTLVRIVKLGQDKDALKAAEMIFDRTGILPFSKNQQPAKKDDDKPKNPPPPVEATDEQALAYLSNAARERNHNA